MRGPYWHAVPLEPGSGLVRPPGCFGPYDFVPDLLPPGGTELFVEEDNWEGP